MGTCLQRRRWMGTEYSADTNSGISVMKADDRRHGVRLLRSFSFLPERHHVSVRHSVLRYDTPSIGPVSLSVGVSVHKDPDDANDHLLELCRLSVNQDFGAANLIKAASSTIADDDAGHGGRHRSSRMARAVNAAWGNRTTPEGAGLR